MHTTIRGLITTGLVVALGTGCAGEPTSGPNQTERSATIPASEATTQATGITTWEYYAVPGGMQALGVTADGTVRTAIEIDNIDDQTVSLRTIGSHPEEIRFNKAGEVLVDTVTGESQAFLQLRSMASDARAAKVQYGWLGCAGALLLEGAACFTAGTMAGLDPVADVACVGSAMVAADECGAE